MSTEDNVATGCGCALVPFLGMFSIWGIIFIIVKLAGTALAGWSWLWILLPIIPVIYIILQAIGLVP